MFTNIGNKIKAFSKAVFWIITTLTVIYGFSLLSNEIYFLGIALIIGGPLSAWITTLFMYGFGELIEKVSDLENAVNNPSSCDEERDFSAPTTSPTASVITPDRVPVYQFSKREYKIICPNCGQEQSTSRTNCINCGSLLL